VLGADASWRAITRRTLEQNRFLIPALDAGVANFRVSEGDQLTDRSGIGNHLPVAGHLPVLNTTSPIAVPNRPEARRAAKVPIAKHQQRLTRGRGEAAVNALEAC